MVAMSRLFTRAELDALARPFVDEFAEALASDGTVTDAHPETVIAVASRIERAYRNFVDGFDAFVGAATEWVVDQHGLVGATGLARALFHATALDTARRGADGATLAAAMATDLLGPLAVAVRNGDHPAALSAYDAMESALRTLHDLGVDRVAAALSFVYRSYGVDALEACLRHCGDQTLLGWMPKDRARPIEVRLAHWARLDKANFTTITIEETDDAFVIMQDPCGTCSRQIDAGCYAAPLDFAVVTEPHPITWGRGDTPVYRTHVAVMHELMPLERVGVPWPEIDCPVGLGVGACRKILRK
jgi:hypothetical protein